MCRALRTGSEQSRQVPVLVEQGDKKEEPINAKCVRRLAVRLYSGRVRQVGRKGLGLLSEDQEVRSELRSSLGEGGSW